MNFSIFEHDQNLGDGLVASIGGAISSVVSGGAVASPSTASGGATGKLISSSGRYLDLVGTADKAGYGSGLIPIATIRESVRRRFVAKNWNVGSVDVAWTGTRYQFRIGVWVRYQHSDATILSDARTILLEVGSTILSAFSNVQLHLEATKSSVVANSGGALPDSQGNSVAGYPGTDNGNGSPGSDFLGNLGLGLGVSTPIVLMGCGLLLLLILRR